MSLKLAETWVAAAFRGLRSAQDAMQLFEKAADEGVEATLVAAPELMNNGKGCLVHWTGHELVVLELSLAQQRAFEIEPNTMVQELEPQAQPPELPPIRHVDLSAIQIDDDRHHDVGRRLTGTFTCAMNDPASSLSLRCALRVRYYHPRRPCRVTGYSHVNQALSRGELPFSFDPLASPRNPDPPRGPFVLFFQLVAAQSWTVLTTCQRISNVLVRVVEFV